MCLKQTISVGKVLELN